MRFQYLLIATLLLNACGGRKISADLARDAVADIPQGSLEKKDIDVVNIRQVGGSEAIAETRLRTAFRLEKVGNKWIVREVRLGHGQWEKVSNLSQALEMVKIEQTKEMLDRIAEAILKYQEANGGLPAFKDYISLSDLLSPVYLTPLIRLDAWRQPLEAERPDANTILMLSAGPDGKFGTGDDIRRTVRPNRD